MVRLRGEEVGDSKSVIEPLIRDISPNVVVHIDGGRGFGKETVEVVLKLGDRETRCVVTFEAWERARTAPEDMREAFGHIIDEMARTPELPAYMLTSRGLDTEARNKDTELLRTIAAGTEADILAEQIFKRSVRK